MVSVGITHTGVMTLGLGVSVYQCSDIKLISALKNQ